VEAALKLVTSKVNTATTGTSGGGGTTEDDEEDEGAGMVLKYPRHVLQVDRNTWDEMKFDDLAEFAVIFAFEVYCEKLVHTVPSNNASVSAQVASVVSENTKPSTTPIENPTTHDVLFGRGCVICFFSLSIMCVCLYFLFLVILICFPHSLSYAFFVFR
jgi:hypothetical protein